MSAPVEVLIAIGPRDDVTIPVRMSRLSGSKALRTPTAEGKTAKLPCVGELFIMWCTEALDPTMRAQVGSGRRINTNYVNSVVTEGRTHRFTTKSGSVYLVEELT